MEAGAVVSQAADLDLFFHPRTIALIGATDDKRKAGYALFRKIVERSEREGTKVYPVNPRIAEIDGIKSYPSLADIPDEVDVAVVMIGDAEKGVRDAVEKGARFCIIFTAGFSELGEKGREREEQLALVARDGGVRLFGPNTNLNAFEFFPDIPGKKLALITQSGHQGRPIAQGVELNIGVAAWAPTGNEADLEVSDFIEYFAAQDDAAVIAAYIEGFKSIPRLRQAAHAAMLAGKPIVLVKIGRTDEGRRMALAHTGHLTGSDAVHEAFFKQYGMIRVDDLDELLETSALFCRLGLPLGDGVCIYAISGGTGAHMADLASFEGLRLPPLEESTQEQLRAIIPDYLAVANPVDNGAQTVKFGQNKQLLDIIMEDPNVDIVVCPITGVLPSMSKVVCTDIVDAYRSGKKQVVVIWGSPSVDDEGYRILVEGQVPMFRSFRSCAVGLRRYLDYGRARVRYDTCHVAQPSVHPTLRELLNGPGPLSEHESQRVVSSYGIPFARTEVVASAADAVAAAERIGYPVVVKANGRTIQHKTDAGLLLVGVADAEAVRLAYQEFTAVDGVENVLVQEMVADGEEVIVGFSTDDQFGPVVVFGLGGIFVEVMEDVAMRVTPLTRADAVEMIHEVKAFPLLDGARGRPKADQEALVELLLNVCRLAMDLRERVSELDLNPVRVLPEGRGVVALDALLVRK
jgi:acetate---CoA ligase (ADP-forming)